MSKLVVFSHKPCWRSPDSPTGFATDGGFPYQMRALSELFDATTLLVPCSATSGRGGEKPLAGHNLSVAPLTPLPGKGLARKIKTLWWLLRNCPRMFREAMSADVIHTPIPGDIGTFGMLIAVALRKRLFVRHCGKWEFQRTLAERFWRWFMENDKDSRNLMLATGEAPDPPSQRNPAIGWIFSTGLTKREIDHCRTEHSLIDGKHPRLINVCRQEKFKGTDVLLESLPFLLDEFPEVEQDVVGDGSALDGFKRLAEHLGLNGRVRFHGQIDRESVIELLKKADLFCYPTKSDGFPKVVLEALACGLPVVATKVSAIPQLLGNGCGILIEDADPEMLARAIRDCLSDGERYRAMSQKALETAENYSLERWRDLIGERLRKAGAPLRSNA